MTHPSGSKAPASALVDATTHKREYIIASAVFTIVAASCLILVSQSFLDRCRLASCDGDRGRSHRAGHGGGAIDDRVARGWASGVEAGDRPEGFLVVLECQPLLVLAAALGLFHLGNAAMLPLYGLAVVAAHQGDPAAFVATTIVVAQAIMLVAALVAIRFVEARGYWLVILITFIALPIRGLFAASPIASWGVFPVRGLGGIAAGLQSVASQAWWCEFSTGPDASTLVRAPS